MQNQILVRIVVNGASDHKCAAVQRIDTARMTCQTTSNWWVINNRNGQSKCLADNHRNGNWSSTPRCQQCSRKVKLQCLLSGDDRCSGEGQCNGEDHFYGKDQRIGAQWAVTRTVSMCLKMLCYVKKNIFPVFFKRQLTLARYHKSDQLKAFKNMAGMSLGVDDVCQKREKREIDVTAICKLTHFIERKKRANRFLNIFS